ncbi:hypothetical protein CDO52_15720 [Nocardiopsis gilva YIM 90087]|uniref:Peptidase inhibitor family I36 protein n=1 Tax=Nocardiopsis gilva YIM 90087 TaxID=1235441 RepID=A0A223S7F6_9ACTN|nr:hypothetical protein [Nocardiopsis gilva]ASU84044.1 hypothetical protein CDO52_15720 [Nocardiopsis gilva YIM 90087]
MKATRILAAGAAAAALSLLATPAASAEEPQPEFDTQAADGKLHGYYGFNRTNHCYGWESNDKDWGVCRNRVSSLWNNGYPGNYDDVWVYWGRNHSGARRGVYNGVVLNDLRKWTYDPGGAGAGEALNNNISSHQWTNLP